MPFSDAKLFQFNRQIQHDNGLFNEGGKYDAANAWVCEQVGRKLAQAYPGHPWGVIAEVEHGIVKFCLAGFSQWTMTIRIDTLKSDPGLKSVVKYAGELLERLKLPRKGFDLGLHREAMAKYPHHFNRNARAPE
ncbi:MAG: hypothetical protein ABFD96_06045 [Armatimonadia bacterium]